MSRWRHGAPAVMFALCASFPVAPASAGEGPSEEEIRQLEAALAADEEAVVRQQEQTGGPAARGTSGLSYDLGVILDVAAAWFSDDAPPQIGAHDPDHTGFTFQQLELTLGGSVDPYFRFDTALLFTPSGVEIEEAYAMTTSLPANLQVRGGLFYHPFGRLNATHPHQWAFLDQSLLVGKFFGGEGSRAVGAELSWLSPLPWFVEATAAVSEASGCCVPSFYGDAPLAIDGVEDLLYTTRLEQFFPFGPNVSLLWGISAQFGPNLSGAGNRSELYGTDLFLRYRPVDSTNQASLSLQLEGIFRTRQVPGDVAQDFGAHAELVWTITRRWQTGARYEWGSGVEADPLHPEWTTARQRVALQGTFFPSHFSRLRLQLGHDDVPWIEQPVLAAMFGLEVIVGAHGAHEF